MSNTGWWKNVISKSSSRGASIRAARTSKYSLTPVNFNFVRAGRIKRVRGGTGLFLLLGWSVGDLKWMQRDLSFGNADKDLAIVSGEMYPELGIFKRSRNARSLVDERSRGKDGKETENKVRCCRHGAGPFKNVSGRSNTSKCESK
jgi:hypothetical protein